MNTDYIPASDAGLLAWSANASALIGAAPASYGVTPGAGLTFSGLQVAYAAALAASTDPATRGGSTIFAKNVARKNLVRNARQIVGTIQGTPAVTAQQKYDLGITVRDFIPTPIPAPTAVPGIQVQSVNGRVVSIRLFDPAHPTRRAKPPGVAGATVMSFVGAAAPDDPGLWRFDGSMSRTAIDIVFPTTVPAGSKVWLTAFYFNARSQSGPACAPVSTYLQFGGEMPMAA